MSAGILLTCEVLAEAADAYIMSRNTCKAYSRQLRNRTRAFATWAGGDAEVTAHLVNRFLLTIEDKRAPETARGYRNSLLGVLRFLGWTPDAPVRRVRIDEKTIDCYVLDELRTLLRCARGFQGVLPNSVPYSDFFQLAIHAGYCTGLRFGDLMGVPTVSIEENGVCRITQSKTGRLVVVRFSPEARALIAKHGQPQAVPWPYSYNQFRLEFAALVLASGVRRGTWRWVRRSAGSYCEMANPGRGHRLLGNSKDVFRGHYAAWSVITPQPIEPPRLTPDEPEQAAVAEAQPDPPATVETDAEPAAPTAGRRAITPRVVRIRQRKGGAA